MGFFNDHFEYLMGIIFTIITLLVLILIKTKFRRNRIFSFNQKNFQSGSISKEILPGLYIKEKLKRIPVLLDYKTEIPNFTRQLNELTNADKLIYIIGEGGAGKSTLTHYIYRNLCNKKAKRTNALYIPIKKLKNSDKPIFDYIYGNVQLYENNISVDTGKFKYDFSIKNWNQLLDFLSKKSALYIFLDGYDEIVYNKNSFDIIDREICEIIEHDNNNVKLIISSRHKPKLNVDVSSLTLYVNNLTDEQKKSFIGEIDYNDIEDDIKEIISTPLLLSMYKTTNREVTNDLEDEDNGYVKNIKTVADIYWNNYCYYWKKIKKLTNGNEDAKVVFARYIIPFIAYNLEYKKIENYFTLNDLKKYTKRFLVNFECFKEKFSFKCNKEDIENLIQSDDFETHYLPELSIIELEKQGEYKFSHLMQKNFFAAVYEYYKDFCILKTNYPDDENKYKPYELLDEKVTIHTITRVFYSNLISRLVYDKQSSYFPNIVKYYCIVSDLYYFGDSEFFKKDRKAALTESIEGYTYCDSLADDAVDSLSKKWISWNMAFIVFDKLLKKNTGEKYIEEEIKIAKYAIKALKYGMSVNYAPAYDKFARIYTTKLFNEFIKYGILEKDDTPEASKEIEKAKGLLKEACNSRYHFSYNSYGALLEKEGKLNEAYKMFNESVKCDPLEFYARSRCGLHLIHNYDKIKPYSEIPEGKTLAYSEAEKCLKDGYKYYNAIKYNKPYELVGIDKLISNLAEFHLILYYQQKIKSVLNDACDYYTALFSIYDRACEDQQITYEDIFNDSGIMRDVLCYCLACLYLQSGHKENVLNNDFNNLCKIVYDYYKYILVEAETSEDKYPFSEHPVFHFERFKKYYDDFVKLYNKGQK